MIQQNISNNRRRGAAMIEYSLLIAGVVLVAAAAVAVCGHKTNDLVSSVAATLPGAHADDNAPIISGKIIETAPQDLDGDGTIDGIALDVDTILANSDGTVERLGANLGTTTSISTLVVEAE